MSALAQAQAVTTRIRPSRPRIAAVLLGTGGVGRALLAQIRSRQPASLVLVGVANSRHQLAAPHGLDAGEALSSLQQQPVRRIDQELLDALDASGAAQRVIIDATASGEVARRHPLWLAAGFHVATANKALNGGSLADWQAIQRASRAGGASYAASATVGAGLPVIDSLRRWRACGDRVTSIEGVFSGSLSWLFNHFDGSRPFSVLLAEARQAGYCEPDPRQDLSGGDVARKLLILARTAGIALDADQVRVKSLVPEALRTVSPEAFRENPALLDRSLAEQLARTRAQGKVLRYMARLDAKGARVGLQQISPSHPAAHLAGTDNLFVLSSSCYDEQPLVIRGPGAGPGVTAQALLGDVCRLDQP